MISVGGVRKGCSPSRPSSGRCRNALPGWSARYQLQNIIENQEKIQNLKNLYQALHRLNQSAPLREDDVNLLKNFASETYINLLGEEKPLILDWEIKKLLIARGNLDDEERCEMESHVTHSYQFLKKFPGLRSFQEFPRWLTDTMKNSAAGAIPEGLPAKKFL